MKNWDYFNLISSKIFLNNRYFYVYLSTGRYGEGDIMDSSTKAKISLNGGTIELEGSEEFVQKNLDSLKNFIYKPISISTTETKNNSPAILQSNSDGIKQSNGGTKKQSRPSVVTIVRPEEFEISGNGNIPPFKAFLDGKKPSNSAPEMITVTGFYLQHYLKKEEFSEGHVMSAYIMAGITRPKKPHQVFINAKNRTQWIKQGSSTDKWILTPFGEDHVRNDLPKKKLNKE